MNQEVLEMIVRAEVAAGLQAALTDAATALAGLAPALNHAAQRRGGRLFKQVVTEATDRTVDTYWWEAWLEYLARHIVPADASGAPARAALQRLARELAASLPREDLVSLREITEETVGGICLLSDLLSEPRKYFVAPNAISLAQAHFNKYAWFRAIYAGRAPVGFMMIVDDPDTPEYFLWRFMVAEPYQGRGYGRQAIALLVDYVRTRPGCRELGVSCGLGEGSPQAFYEKQGFVSTGKVIDDELVLTMALG